MKKELSALISSGVTCKVGVRGWNGGTVMEKVDVEEVAEWASNRIAELEARVLELEEDLAKAEAAQ